MCPASLYYVILVQYCTQFVYGPQTSSTLVLYQLSAIKPPPKHLCSWIITECHEEHRTVSFPINLVVI